MPAALAFSDMAREAVLQKAAVGDDVFRQQHDLFAVRYPEQRSEVVRPADLVVFYLQQGDRFAVFNISLRQVIRINKELRFASAEDLKQPCAPFAPAQRINYDQSHRPERHGADQRAVLFGNGDEQRKQHQQNGGA